MLWSGTWRPTYGRLIFAYQIYILTTVMFFSSFFLFQMLYFYAFLSSPICRLHINRSVCLSESIAEIIAKLIVSSTQQLASSY